MIPLPTLNATADMAQRLAPILRPGDTLALEGDLGAGKTAFARALLKALGVAGEVPSPTFTLIQSYDLPAFAIHHFDLYRLKSPAELEELGWHDALADGLTLVEWPQRAGPFLPKQSLTLHFLLDADGHRSCRIAASPAWQTRLAGLLP